MVVLHSNSTLQEQSKDRHEDNYLEKDHCDNSKNDWNDNIQAFSRSSSCIG